MTDLAENSSPDPYVNTTLDDEFRIEEKLGTGGMGTVYRAVQRLTERSVAIKVLHPHVCDEETTLRFLQEAQIISRLSHPNIVTVYKFGQHQNGLLYIAMEYLEGCRLDALLGAPMELDRALPLMIQTAEGLAYAHERRVVHRDIKPENLFVMRAGRSEVVKLLDFGIAKVLDRKAGITRAGLLFGSPPYMAPEQWQEVRDLDGRTDIYALGCVYYELITGKQPFPETSIVGYMRAHIEGPRPPHPLEAGTRPGVPRAIGDIVMKCLAPNRANRYPNAYALVEALKEEQVELEALKLARSGMRAKQAQRTSVVTQVTGEMPDARPPAPPSSIDPPRDASETPRSPSAQSAPSPPSEPSTPLPPRTSEPTARSSNEPPQRTSNEPPQRTSNEPPRASNASNEPPPARTSSTSNASNELSPARASTDPPPQAFSEPPEAIRSLHGPRDHLDIEADEERHAQLRAIARQFPRRDAATASVRPRPDLAAWRAHLLLVTIGCFLSICLAVAVVMLR